jgi:hypothetical protein
VLFSRLGSVRYWLVDYQACGGAPLLTVLAAGALPHWEQMVTAMPEVRRMMLKQGDEFLLLACDGIWDVCTNQEVRAGSRGGSGLQPSPAMPVLAFSRPDAADRAESDGCLDGLASGEALVGSCRCESR